MVGQDAAESQEGTPIQAKRVFEQPSDTLSMYSDYVQVVGTGHEVIVQFYETVPGIPLPSGAPETVTTRLRATIVISRAHAANLGKSLLQNSETEPPTGVTE